MNWSLQLKFLLINFSGLKTETSVMTLRWYVKDLQNNFYLKKMCSAHETICHAQDIIFPLEILPVFNIPPYD